MATKHEVNSISKSISANGIEMITHIGGNGNESRSWKISQQEAISGIENNMWEFFVKQGSKTHNLIICICPLGNKYLKIENDGV
jgi:hypothetical protein